MIEVEITKEDIRKAKLDWTNIKNNRVSHCPIAQAFKRLNPTAVDVIVTNKVWVYFENYTLIYDMDDKGRDFVTKADARDDNVSPTTLEFWEES